MEVVKLTEVEEPEPEFVYIKCEDGTFLLNITYLKYIGVYTKFIEKIICDNEHTRENKNISEIFTIEIPCKKINFETFMTVLKTGEVNCREDMEKACTFCNYLGFMEYGDTMYSIIQTYLKERGIRIDYLLKREREEEKNRVNNPMYPHEDQFLLYNWKVAGVIDNLQDGWNVCAATDKDSHCFFYRRKKNYNDNLN